MSTEPTNQDDVQQTPQETPPTETPVENKNPVEPTDSEPTEAKDFVKSILDEIEAEDSQKLESVKAEQDQKIRGIMKETLKEFKTSQNEYKKHIEEQKKEIETLREQINNISNGSKAPVDGAEDNPFQQKQRSEVDLRNDDEYIEQVFKQKFNL